MDKELIKKILKESVGKYTRICILDFDGTLVDTPLPDSGRKEYKEKTGQDWPYKGWWSRPETLDPVIFKMPVIASTIAAYNKERQVPNTLMVMMTGRLARLAPAVENVLTHYNLKFDEYLYNTGGETLHSKINYLESLMAKYPDVKEIKMFEDRTEHIPTFEAWGATKDIEFEVIEVKSGHHD